MKEIGHCPRCMGKDVIVMKTIGARREVCKNCGFTDIYSGLTSSTPCYRARLRSPVAGCSERYSSSIDGITFQCQMNHAGASTLNRA